jgi:UV DNA damage repair endonuclease
VAAIFVEVLKCRTQLWKRTTQESFQQSLVEIGSVVSEEKIFLEFHPHFFLICIIGQNRQKLKVHKKSRNICLKALHYALTVQILAHSGLK